MNDGISSFGCKDSYFFKESVIYFLIFVSYDKIAIRID